jgi:hypothetical protein
MVVARMGVWGKGQQSLAPRQYTVSRSASSAPIQASRAVADPEEKPAASLER